MAMTIQEESLIGKLLNNYNLAEQESARMRPVILAKNGLIEYTPSLTTDQQTQYNAWYNELVNLQNAMNKMVAGGSPAGDPGYTALYNKYQTIDKQLKDLAGPRLRQMTEEEQLASMTPLEQQNYNIQKLANERELKALRGELEIDPYVERTLAEEEAATKERLLKNLGTGALESSGGSIALADLAKRAAETRYDVAHGEMTNSEAIARNRTNIANQSLENVLGTIASNNATRTSNTNTATIPLSWYSRNREFSEALENQDSGGGDDWGGALGGIAGSILGSFAGGIGSKAGGMVGNKLGSWLTR